MTTSSVENLINLKTLQRVDSSIIEILDNACQVAIYKYERELEKWEGTDIEGTLFLYRRTLFPHHGFIIVNRMSTTNFVESITDDMQFKLQEPYLLYKNHSGDIIGSWFYEHKDLQRIFEKIQSIILKPVSPLKRQRRASESESHTKKEENQDILALLSEAHLQYIKKANDDRSRCKDANNLNIYSEKKPLEKSVPSAVKKQESEGPMYSFEENYPVSPRRRFMSTGSFDPHRASYLSRMLSANQFSARSGKIDNVLKDSSSEENQNVKSSDHSTDYSQVSILEETDPYVLKDSSNEDSSKHLNLKSKNSSHHSTDHSKTTVVAEASNSNKYSEAGFEIHARENKADDLKCPGNQNWRNPITEHSHIHFESIQSAIKVHIQDNPRMMLKIHEAYVSSLKSHFNQSSF